MESKDRIKVREMAGGAIDSARAECGGPCGDCGKASWHLQKKIGGEKGSVVTNTQGALSHMYFEWLVDLGKGPKLVILDPTVAQYTTLCNKPVDPGELHDAVETGVFAPAEHCRLLEKCGFRPLHQQDPKTGYWSWIGSTVCGTGVEGHE